MNAWRVAISAFVLVLLSVVLLGLIWTGTNQPAAPRLASFAVLGASGAAGMFALVRLWR
jgi:hypothetical protein